MSRPAGFRLRVFAHRLSGDAATVPVLEVVWQSFLSRLPSCPVVGMVSAEYVKLLHWASRVGCSIHVVVCGTRVFRVLHTYIYEQ